jgi:hypothetical protein
LKTTPLPRPIFNLPKRSRMSLRRRCKCSIPRTSQSCRTSSNKFNYLHNLLTNLRKSNKKFRMKIRVWSMKLNKVAQMTSSRIKDLSTILLKKTRILIDSRPISFSRLSPRDSKTSKTSTKNVRSSLRRLKRLNNNCLRKINKDSNLNKN